MNDVCRAAPEEKGWLRIAASVVAGWFVGMKSLDRRMLETHWRVAPTWPQVPQDETIVVDLTKCHLVLIDLLGMDVIKCSPIQHGYHLVSFANLGVFHSKP